MHGGVSVTDKDGSQMSVNVVFRVVNSLRQYHIAADKMMYNNQENGLSADHLFEFLTCNCITQTYLSYIQTYCLLNNYLNI